MESKNIILILTVIVIILAVGVVAEVFILNNNNTQSTAAANNTTSTNTTVVSISNDEKSDSSENSIESNRPKNDPNYKGYNPYHDSEVTKDGWNPRDHEVGRDNLGDGSQRIRYDDGYFRIVDENGYVITYGYGG